ncbi:MAG: AAA family ATPase [Candidatus Saccharimonadales bacterium]
MNGKTKPYGILVFGAPASGKSQFASQFAERFKCPFLDFGKNRTVSYSAAAGIVEQVAVTGQNIVIEGCLDAEKQRNDMRHRLKKRGYVPVLVWIQADANTIKRRLHQRYKSVEKAKAEFAACYDHMEAPADIEKPIVISGKHTFTTQLKVMLAKLSKQR